MSTHNIGFYEEISKNYHLIIIKYHQIRTLFLLLVYGKNRRSRASNYNVNNRIWFKIELIRDFMVVLVTDKNGEVRR